MVPTPWIADSTIWFERLAKRVTFYHSEVDTSQCGFVLVMPDEENQSNALGDEGLEALCAMQ